MDYLKTRLQSTQVEQETPTAFLQHSRDAEIGGKTLKFCYDRLTSLLKTLEVVDMDEFNALLVANFAALVGTYSKGFALILEPYDGVTPTFGSRAAARVFGRVARHYPCLNGFSPSSSRRER